MGVTSFAPGNDTTLFLSGDGYFFLFEKRLPRAKINGINENKTVFSTFQFVE